MECFEVLYFFDLRVGRNCARHRAGRQEKEWRVPHETPAIRSQIPGWPGRDKEHISSTRRIGEVEERVDLVKRCWRGFRRQWLRQCRAIEKNYRTAAVGHLRRCQLAA